MRYLLEIMKIPKLELKLECWYFSLTFVAKVAELKKNTVVLVNASKQLMNSKKFSHLLLVIALILFSRLHILTLFHRLYCSWEIL